MTARMDVDGGIAMTMKESGLDAIAMAMIANDPGAGTTTGGRADETKIGMTAIALAGVDTTTTTMTHGAALVAERTTMRTSDLAGLVVIAADLASPRIAAARAVWIPTRSPTADRR